MGFEVVPYRLKLRPACASLLSTVLVVLAPNVASAATYNAQLVVPYAQDNRIARNIQDECTELGAKLSKFLVQFAGKKGIEVNLVDELDTQAGGHNLYIEITDAVSRGNAFIGHQKYMEARAELFVDGVSQGEQYYHRDSMGGFGAGYKGSCSVLGRTSKALGKDFSVWLAELEAGTAG